MKARSYPLRLLFWILAMSPLHGSSPSGPKIPLNQGEPVEISRIVLVNPDGLRLLVPGNPKPVDLSWERVDLKKLALNFPKLDGFRQEAVLLGEGSLVRAAAMPNYYYDFLNARAAAPFGERFVVEDRASSGWRFYRADYRLIDRPVTDPGDVLLHTNRDLIKLDPISDSYRETFEGTMDRMLFDLSNHRNSRSRELWRQLIDHPHLSTNLLRGFRHLAAAYPDDARAEEMVSAVERIFLDPNNAHADQERLRSFLEHARERAGMDSRMRPIR
ncbi:MAG: hypothetical protein ACFCU4_02280 [Puniceicoccaceae bacterium]